VRGLAKQVGTEPEFAVLGRELPRVRPDEHGPLRERCGWPWQAQGRHSD
jgi:hypothetical protein